MISFLFLFTSPSLCMPQDFGRRFASFYRSLHYLHDNGQVILALFLVNTSPNTLVVLMHETSCIILVLVDREI